MPCTGAFGKEDRQVFAQYFNRVITEAAVAPALKDTISPAAPTTMIASSIAATSSVSKCRPSFGSLRSEVFTGFRQSSAFQKEIKYTIKVIEA